MKELLGSVAVLISIAGVLPYLRETIQGRIKPHFISWLIWSIITIIAFLGQWAKGAGPGAWVTGAMGLTNIIIAIFAFKNGTRNITGFDRKLFFGSILAIVLWVLIKEPIFSLVVVIAIDGAAVYYTVKKTLKEPNSEAPVLFYSNILKTILAIIALQQYNSVTLLYPIYQLISNSALIISTRPKLLRNILAK